MTIHRFKNNIKNCFDLDYKQLFKRRLPITQWLPEYKSATIFQDLLAGFTVSLTEIPQAIAYAGIAGLSPEYGLYSSFLGGFVYAFFGSCKEINLGPTSIISIMLQPHIAKLGADVAVLLCFLSGIIIFLLGILNLGFLIEFFSYPVIAAFTCAASVQIAATQLNGLFGIDGSTHAFLEALQEFFGNLDRISKWDAILGVVSFLFLIGLRELRRFGTFQFGSHWSTKRKVIAVTVFLVYLARSALIIIIGTTIAYKFRDQNLFKVTGEVRAGFPLLEAPSFSSKNGDHVYSFKEIVTKVGASIIFIPLLAILECVAIAKSFTQGKTLDATQEILTLGIANICSSFVRSMPITGSFTRSTINHSCGVQSPFGGVFTSLITLLAIAFLTPCFYYVPKASIAAVIISAMVFLFEGGAFVLLWKNKKTDLVPFLTTFLSCLFVSLEYGILIGIVVNLLFILYPSARPKITITQQSSPRTERKIVLVTIHDNLLFPAAENVREQILTSGDSKTIVVLDGKGIRNVDITIAKCFLVFSEELIKRGNSVVFWNFKTSVTKVCVGLDKNMARYFKEGDFDEIIEEDQFKTSNV